MDDNAAETRNETIAALNAALAGLENGEGLSRFTLESALPEGEEDLSVIWP